MCVYLSSDYSLPKASIHEKQEQLALGSITIALY